MSKISDEMREWAELLKCSAYTKVTAEKINTIADRIDREMMERPLAADGKLLVDGETVYDSNGNKYHVNEVYPLVNVSTSTYSCSMFPDRFTHESPDSFELIADELDEWKRKAAEKIPGFGLEEDALHALADRIRKLAKEGEHE